jgi:hypothetical protein
MERGTIMRVRPVIVSFAAVLLSVPMALVAPTAAFAARPWVDPNTLNPVPHTTGQPVCGREGNLIVCHTTIDINDDYGTFDSGINCGGTELQWSIQYTLLAGSVATFNASGNVISIVYDESWTGSFSNPDNGMSAVWTQQDRLKYAFPTPGDNRAGTMTQTELQQVYGPAGNLILTDAGRESWDIATYTRLTAAGTHPIDDYFNAGDPSGLAPLCKALT